MGGLHGNRLRGRTIDVSDRWPSQAEVRVRWEKERRVREGKEGGERERRRMENGKEEGGEWEGGRPRPKILKQDLSLTTTSGKTGESE